MLARRWFPRMFFVVVMMYYAVWCCYLLFFLRDKNAELHGPSPESVLQLSHNEFTGIDALRRTKLHQSGSLQKKDSEEQTRPGVKAAVIKDTSRVLWCTKYQGPRPTQFHYCSSGL